MTMIQFNWIWKIIIQYMMLILHTQPEIVNTERSMKTIFSCLNRTAGFYADINASCKIYHTCDEYGNKFTYHCPEETAFRQDALICDHAHLVQCQGSIISSTKEYIKEEKDNSSDTKHSIDNDQSLFHSFYMTQPTNTSNKERYGFVFNSRQIFKNFNKTETTGRDIISSFYPLSYINYTTNIPIDHSINTQSMHIISQYNENGLRKNENFSTPSQSFHEKDKLNEKLIRMNQKGYLYQKVNDALYSFLKLPSNTFSGSNQTQENNVKIYQSTKNPIDFLKLSPINYRNYPYLETLKSIQKNTKMISTTVHSTTASMTLSTTEIPVYALTLSLKPLIPSELEYDPYYPKFSTTTEPYYTSTQNLKEWSTQTVRSTTHLELPAVLPDLNSLDDIVDRRKLLYIPRIKFN
ncbi:uncharacterized protein LOC122577948 isoform X1 [Bombus pyrosoma]|uniref:uncharacterized protein LOC122577948 isoform X1 n=2 Tax=Bombus pyrosoma TaxID=396416 RepID=UPI001CB99E4C|nr:uncharacterized protein LOC122577948 isoform X1 [Bombus pyrosoma]XP_043605753.1 uncharacterized protein LOC122577948 isoform X1 [Bombus pyrosoma]